MLIPIFLYILENSIYYNVDDIPMVEVFDANILFPDKSILKDTPFKYLPTNE